MDDQKQLLLSGSQKKKIDIRRIEQGPCSNDLSDSDSSSFGSYSVTSSCSEEIPTEPHKMLFSIVFLLLGGLATHLSRAITTDRVPDVQPLPDLILDSSKYLPWGRSGSEIVMGVAMIITFLIVILHKYRFVIFRRIFFQIGLHYFYRSVLMAVTVLPKPNTHYQCIEKLGENATYLDMGKRVFELASGMGLKLASRHDFCGDYIYSGHTMIMVMSYLAIKEYSPKSWWLVHLCSFLISVSGIVILVLGRGHYTIDVILSYWFTTRVWWTYHGLSSTRSHKRNPFANCWWFHLHQFLEQNVTKPLPHGFNWPLPRLFFRRWQSPDLSTRMYKNI